MTLRGQYTVMPGLDPRIHGVPRRRRWIWRERDAAGIVRELERPAARRPWMAESSPAMTMVEWFIVLSAPAG